MSFQSNDNETASSSRQGRHPSQPFVVASITALACVVVLATLGVTYSDDRQSTPSSSRMYRSALRNNAGALFAERSEQMLCQIGSSRGDDGSSSTPDYTDEEDQSSNDDELEDTIQQRTCSTRVSTESGFALDAAHQRYNLCYSNQMIDLAACRNAAESFRPLDTPTTSDAVVGFSYVSDGRQYCEIYLDYPAIGDLRDTPGDDCPPLFWADPTTRPGTGRPVAVDGAPNTASYSCTPLD